MFKEFSLFLVGLQICYAANRNVQFSRDFSFGVATSAYQTEGAWNKDGKGENIWDRLLHTKPGFANGTNGDVASKGYYKMMEDVDLLNFLNVGHYRLSISWSRILPNGKPSYVNPLGVEYYRRLFRVLKQNQIEPFVTLYHWDLPQPLQDMGGFLNKSMVNWFRDYARVAFELFGDDVKYWSTFNDPYSICANGYGGSSLAPALNKSGEADYICGHNLLLAHAAAYHLYDKEFRKIQDGRISININSNWVEPISTSEEDKMAAEVQKQFMMGWFANPIYNGDYPEVMKERIRERSLLQGKHNCRLPSFSREEREMVRGTHDYFSLGTQTMLLAKSVNSPLRPVNLQQDVGAKVIEKQGDVSWGMRKLLVWIKKNYNNPSIFITENGLGTKSATPEDPERIAYIQSMLVNVYDAMTIDNVRVYGYTYNSFMDGFNWRDGYSKKFGLFAVDFTDPDRTRTARRSAYFYKRLCSTGNTSNVYYSGSWRRDYQN
ncbi:myrosinase 1 [Leptinotarsa decemlineata]|uniref:myrosinase 1 n=1 Tax=Leptinotarsa decemlineata TaxID=7539 RepID=UPI003D308E1E